MQQESQDWPAARIVHFTGGCRAISVQGPLLEFEPRTLSGRAVFLDIKTYHALFTVLKNNGLAAIGVDFYSHSLELKGIVPPDWRSFLGKAGKPWLCQNEIDRASNIGNAAFNKKDGRLWDLSKRISHQLHVTAWRLRQISESYREQLKARIDGKKFIAGDRFEDGYTWLAYLSFQSFLVDACVLRDYLAEFYSSFICQEKDLISNPVITSMGSLYKRVLSKTKEIDLVTTTLKNATNEGGWLHTLGAYRDLVVHCAPIASAESRLMALCSEFEIGGTERIPAITLPIPKDPIKASKLRASGARFQDIEEELRLFVKANRGDSQSLDGLIYAYTVLSDLTQLTNMLLNKSPIEPEMLVFNEENIVGEITIEHI